jgi:hypothetical protein
MNRAETVSQNLTIEVVLGYVFGMDVRAGSSAALFAVLEQLKKAWIKGGWSWDSRFSCVASSFNVELEAEARAVVLRFLPNEWTSKTIAGAPQALKEVAEATGGVRTDQRVFTGDMSGRLVGYGLWWPWGDEITVSLRIGLGGYVLDPDMNRLRETFGTAD